MGRKQLEVPGTERPNSIPELDAAAEKFKASSKKRKRAQDNEIADRETVIRLMRQHKLSVYEDTDMNLIVTLSSKDMVRVADLADEADDIEPDDLPVPNEKVAQLSIKKASPEA